MQARHVDFRHFFIQFFVLIGYFPCTGGTLAFIILSLMFCCLLKATKSGFGKTSSRYLSCVIIDFQCFLVIFGIFGMRGSYSATKTGLLWVSCLTTFLKAVSRGRARDLAIAASMIELGYFRFFKHVF